MKILNIKKLNRKALNPKIVYKKLIDNMNEAVWVGDKNERTVYVNKKFASMLGYKDKEMLGRESYDFWDEKTKKKVKHVNLSDRKKGLTSSYEGNLVTKSGKKIPVLLSGAPLSNGGTIGIMTDLSELKKKEQKERILNKAIEYSTDAIITFDKNLKILSWNKGAKIVFGYKNNEILNSKVTKIISKEDVNEILSNPKTLYNFEFIGKHKNKNALTIAATLTPIFTKDQKNILFYLLIARDITNQAKFEEDLALKYKKMKEAYNKFGIIRRQMDYVFELLDIATSDNNERHISDFIVSSIIMLTKVDACILRKYNPKKDTLELLSSFGPQDWEGKSNIKFKNSLAEKAFLQESPLKIIDITTESKYQSKYLAKKNDLCSLLLIPLKFRSKFIGSISLYASPNRKSEIFENDFIEKYAKIIETVMAKALI